MPAGELRDVNGGRRAALQQIARSDYIPQREGHQVIRSCQKGDEEAARAT